MLASVHTMVDSVAGSAGPLSGLRILELGGIGPTPFCGMLLSDLGAEVIRIDRFSTKVRPILQRGRRSMVIDLKEPRGVDIVRRIAADCDAVFEGFRPGVAERLGVGPDDLRADHRALVYGRMTGWGQTGPLSDRPGHDINYLALSGALHAIGHRDGPPVPPLNLLADFGGGGMLLGFGLVSGILRARITGEGDVVDCSMVDGVAALLSMTLGFLNEGQWIEERGSNDLDGGSPWYGVYVCRDGHYMAVGCREPQFYEDFCRHMGIDSADIGDRDDRSQWPRQRSQLEAIFVTKTRDEWTEVFADSQSCVTPVLSFREAAHEHHHVARGTYHVANDVIQGMPVPRFATYKVDSPNAVSDIGADTDAVMTELGFTSAEIDELRRAGVVGPVARA